ncbi:hypothetical protein SAMN05428985_105138 [Nocardioides sp. YR527]|uniref:hypothetical protein n=1 Tax=Nocardioides sp. YR527 TaxID=1881028 RepID=UPI00087FC3A9|nr:hypothetical protein [Nocardioides sp. YR527]SDK65859.1 hypothetical protein SAMN05428985_105138 [Nocardioides sp. YR527]
MTASTPDFEATYRRHVDGVVAGDMKSVLADMAPGSVPSVFEGVRVPGAQVDAAEIRSARVDGERGIGEAVYTTPEGTIGLRSGWGLVDGAWKADSLENFDPASQA